MLLWWGGSLTRTVGRMFGYDAVEATSGKRRESTGVLRSEDEELPWDKRRKLIAQLRDAHRNIGLLGWGLRRHLDYVTTFSFQPKTGSKALNVKLVDFIEEWSQPENFDACGVHSLAEFIRLAELRRMVDGDLGVLKLASGLVQPIEGDRIRTPYERIDVNDLFGDPSQRWVQGVEIDLIGRHLNYAIHRRARYGEWGMVGSTRFELERIVPSRDCLFFAHRDRFDQVRGISPLAPAINAALDTYEGIDYALAKLKVAQLLTLAIYRGDPNTVPEEDTDYSKFPFGKRPAVLDMKPGERGEILESRTPAAETQAFIELMIQLVLKCLDIPYSFFKENFSNYSGSRQALVMYQESAKIKRNVVLWLLNHLTRWRIALAVADRRLPQSALGAYFQWMPNGIPWIDPEKEGNANTVNLANGTTSRIRICRENGIDVEDILDEELEYQRLREERGLPPLPAAVPKAPPAAPQKPAPADGRQQPDPQDGGESDVATE